jgi:hypothetical protein
MGRGADLGVVVEELVRECFGREGHMLFLEGEEGLEGGDITHGADDDAEETSQGKVERDDEEGSDGIGEENDDELERYAVEFDLD